MTDRELLELAAKSAGYRYEWAFTTSGEEIMHARVNDSCCIEWMPRDNDGDAFRLAATLKLDVLQDAGSVSVKRYVGPDVEAQYLAYEGVGECRLKATRYAIFIAAAEIGKSMR